MKRVEVQCFEGDGVETAEAREIRLRQEREAARAKQEEARQRWNAKQARRALNYKQSLRDHPLAVNCIKINQSHFVDSGYLRLELLTEMPPETFNHIKEVPRPKLTVRTPMNPLDNIAPNLASIEYPTVLCFHHPVVHSIDHEKVAKGRNQYDEFVQVWKHTLVISYSREQDFSARTYKKLRELYAKASAQKVAAS